MKKYQLKPNLSLWLAFVITGLDQISKAIVKNSLGTGEIKDFIPGFLQIRLVKNTGAAFSLFSNATQILTFLSLSVSIILIIWIWRSRPMPIIKGFSISFLLAGCLGNGIDRWRLGYVNDFLDFIPIDFPIFNLADISINIAVILFFIDSLYQKKINNKSY